MEGEEEEEEEDKDARAVDKYFSKERLNSVQSYKSDISLLSPVNMLSAL